jgi:hypothetical protein
MTRDSVVHEVRAAREAYAARFGFDLTAIGRDLQARERTSGRVVLAPPVAESRPDPAPRLTGEAIQATGGASGGMLKSS